MNVIAHVSRATTNYDQQQAFTSRVVAMASACTSLVACILGMYALLAVDPRRLIFRYQLICFLLCSDFLKALILLIYPVRVLINPLTYYSVHFCQVMGFLTAVSIEAADFAILAFAVHTLLIIFRPELGVTLKRSSRTEAGLYRFRFYVYGGCVLVPLIFASLAFIGGKDTYQAFTCWCYLPLRPIWLRYVLSWGPRYTILSTIIVVYVVIYVHVIRKSRRVSSVLLRMQRRSSARGSTNNDSDATLPPSDQRHKLSMASVSKSINSRWLSFTQKISPHQETTKEDNNISMDQSETSSNESVHTPPQYPEVHSHDTSPTFVAEFQSKGAVTLSMSDPPSENTPTSATTATNIQIASVEAFKKREKAIRRQVTSVFLYPLAYMFIWFLPFIMSIFQTRTGEEPRGIYWLKIAMAFFQPINGFVDTLVFFYREKPWQQTIKRNFEREYFARLSNAATHVKSQNMRNLLHQLRAQNYPRPSHPMSVCSSLMGIPQYSEWRRFLSWLRLPLFRLPSDESINAIEWRVMHQDKRGESIPDIFNPAALPTIQASLDVGPGTDPSSKSSAGAGAGAGINFSKYQSSAAEIRSQNSEPSNSLHADAPRNSTTRESLPVSPTNVMGVSGTRNPITHPLPRRISEIELQSPQKTKPKPPKPSPIKIVPNQPHTTSTPTSVRRLLALLLRLPVSLTRRANSNSTSPNRSTSTAAPVHDEQHETSTTPHSGDDSSSEEMDFVAFLRAEP